MDNVTEEDTVWRTYPEYPFIEVNQFGEVRTKDRYVHGRNGSKRLIKGRILKQQLLPNGYMQVRFHANYKNVCLYVHRAVAITYIPNHNNYPEVNHKDNDQTNNTVSNLEWCTPEYNIAYREKYGIALNHPVIAINPETSDVFWFKSQREASRQLGVNAGNVNCAINGKLNQAGGFLFCNADKNSVEKTREKLGDEMAEKVKKLINKNSNYLNKC